MAREERDPRGTGEGPGSHVGLALETALRVQWDTSTGRDWEVHGDIVQLSQRLGDAVPFRAQQPEKLPVL